MSQPDALAQVAAAKEMDELAALMDSRTRVDKDAESRIECFKAATSQQTDHDLRYVVIGARARAGGPRTTPAA